MQKRLSKHFVHSLRILVWSGVFSTIAGGFADINFLGHVGPSTSSANLAVAIPAPVLQEEADSVDDSASAPKVIVQEAVGATATLEASAAVGAITQDDVAPKASVQQKAVAVADGKIRFSFKNTEWKTVIEWFAEQADLVLLEHSDFPKGTYTNVDGNDYSVKDGLDQLNHMLLLEGYVLLRYRNQLVMIDHAKEGIPAELVQTITPEELDDRGTFELVNCKFDIRGLDAATIERQVNSLVQPPRGLVTMLAVSDELFVRENAGRLRTIRDVIDRAKAKSKTIYQKVDLKHVAFEAVMRMARAEFGMRAEENRLDDGSLSVTIVNSETQPWISGTKDKVEKMIDLVNEMDNVENAANMLEAEEYQIKYYEPKNDPKIVFNVLMSQFDGRADMRLTLSDSDVIYAKAREQDHVQIRELLDRIESNGTITARIPTFRMLSDELIEKLKEAMGMATSSLLEDDNASNEPKIIFLEDDNNDQIIVRATARLIDEVKELAVIFDPPPGESIQKKKPWREFSLPKTDSEDVIDQFQEIWGMYPKTNELKLVLPSERASSSLNDVTESTSKFRFPSYDREMGKGAFSKDFDPADLSDDQFSQLIIQMMESREQQSVLGNGSDSAEFQNRPGNQERPQSSPARSVDQGASPTEKTAPKPSAVIRTTTSATGKSKTIQTIGGTKSSGSKTTIQFATTLIQEDELPTPKSADTNQESDPADPAQQTDDSSAVVPRSSSLYRSIPGDPVVVERTSGGIMLRSRDMEALDLAEQIMLDLTRDMSLSVEALPAKTVFFLGFRSAEEVANEIKEILGLEDGGGGGGGGGGGMADMLGGAMQNAIGGAAGDLLGGLMGGGGGGGSSSEKTVGTVSIHVDNFLNAMIVYAGPEDTSEIETLIDLKDRPTAPHDPKINGEARSIPIRYRDPEGIKTQVETHFATYIRKPEGQGGQPQPQVNPAELMKQMMSGKGGKGGGSADAAKPKMSVSVDTEAKLLLVMGPGYLVSQVEEFVKQLDYEGAVVAKNMEILDLPPGVTPTMVRTLFPQYFEGGTSTTPRTGATGATPAGGAAAAAAAPDMNAIRKAMQGGGFGGFGGGGGTGGGSRGTGGQGGSGRGGAGGGGRGGRG